MDTTSSSEQPVMVRADMPAPDWREIAHTAVAEHRAIQHSAELAMLLTIADTAEVSTVLEVGTFAGGTAWAFGQLPSVRKLITIDGDPQAEAYSMVASLGPQASLVRGYAQVPEVRETVFDLLDGTPADLLFIDGSHDYESADADFRIYGQMVRPGGLIALHDVEIHVGQPAVEVHQLWNDIRHAYTSVKITAAPGEWAGIGIIWK